MKANKRQRLKNYPEGKRSLIEATQWRPADQKVSKGTLKYSEGFQSSVAIVGLVLDYTKTFTRPLQE